MGSLFPPHPHTMLAGEGDLFGEALGSSVQVRVRVAQAVDEDAQEVRRKHPRYVFSPVRGQCRSPLCRLAGRFGRKTPS